MKLGSIKTQGKQKKIPPQKQYFPFSKIQEKKNQIKLQKALIIVGKYLISGIDFLPHL